MTDPHLEVKTYPGIWESVLEITRVVTKKLEITLILGCVNNNCIVRQLLNNADEIRVDFYGCKKPVQNKRGKTAGFFRETAAEVIVGALKGGVYPLVYF